MSAQSEKKERRSINSYAVMFVVMAFVALLTWFIPGGEYQMDEAGNAIAGTYSMLPANPQGLWDLIMAPINGMFGTDTVSAAIPISLYIMLFGSFLKMMEATGVIDYALTTVSNKFKNNTNMLIIILVFIMSFLGTSQGAYEEGYVYVSLFLPIFLLLGMDTITVLILVIFGTMAGNIASVINPFSTGIAHDIAGIPFGEGIIQRIIVFFIVTGLAAILVIMYSNRIRKKPELSVQYYRREEDVEEFAADTESESTSDVNPSKQNGLLVIFILTFVIMVLALFPWMSINENWTIFANIANWINNTPIVNTIIGSDVVPLGEWYFAELNALMLISALISGLYAGFGVDKTVDIIMKGASELVPTALMVPLARGIQILMTDGNITATILNFAENTLGSLPTVVFLLFAFIIYMIFSYFMPSSTGLAGATISVMVPLGVFAGVPAYVMVMVYNFALGIVKMFTPTSVIVMTCISYAKVDYGSWLKAIWKDVLTFAIVCFALLIVFTYI